MTSEDLARLCFAARPVLWALAIIAILYAASILIPRIWGKDSGDDGPQNSQWSGGIP
jgi:hypothetical protein